MRHKTKYTLIELLISLGIFAVMMLLLLNFFSKYQDFTYRASCRNDIVADHATFFAQLDRDIKSAITAINSASLVTHDFRTSHDITMLGNTTFSISTTGDTLTLFVKSKVLTKSDGTMFSDGSNGSGSIGKVKYSLTDRTIIRDFTDYTPAKIDGSSPSGTTSSEKIIQCVKASKLKFYIYETRESFVRSSPPTYTPLTTGTFYKQIPVGITGLNSIYAILVTTEAYDPNPNTSVPEIRSKTDFKKLIIVNP